MSSGSRLLRVCTLVALISIAVLPFPVFAEGDEEVIDITADEIAYDRKNAEAVARGNIQVLFKSFRITGDYAEYDEKSKVVKIKGKARFEDAQEGTEFLAEEIMFFLEKEEIKATGGVSLKSKDGSITASGERLSYFSLGRRAIIEGSANVEIEGKVFQASVITVFLDEERVLAEGGTKAVIPQDE